MYFKGALIFCTLLGITWKEESPTAPSGVLDPGGVEEEEVTSGPGKKTLEHRPHDTESEPTWSRVRDSDYRGVALLLKGVLRLSGGLRADHHSGPVPVCVNCIRLLVDCHEL